MAYIWQPSRSGLAIGLMPGHCAPVGHKADLLSWPSPERCPAWRPGGSTVTDNRSASTFQLLRDRQAGPRWPQHRPWPHQSSARDSRESVVWRRAPVCLRCLPNPSRQKADVGFVNCKWKSASN